MPYTEAGYKATKKYREQNIKRVPLDMQKSDYDAVKAHAEGRGEAVNKFIKRAIAETMQRDQQRPDDQQKTPPPGEGSGSGT